MSLESLLYEFHEQRRDSYLSPESVRRSLGTPTCPRFPVLQEDRDRLMELATYGMVVSEPPGLPSPPDFHPCPSPPNFRRSYLEASSTVDRLFYKQWQMSSMLIIPTSMALEIPGIHFEHPSWAVKSGAPQGRNVHDISCSEVPEHILNGSRPSRRSWLQTRCEERMLALRECESTKVNFRGVRQGLPSRCVDRVNYTTRPRR